MALCSLEEIKMLVLALQFSKGVARGPAFTRWPITVGSGTGTHRGARPFVPGDERSNPSKQKRRQSCLSEPDGRETYNRVDPSRQPDSAPTGIVSSREERNVLHRPRVLLRKEVIQPHLPVRLPCYDFTPITDPTFDGSFLAVRPPASGVADFRGVTGGVYKARERIHPGVLIRDY